MYIFFWVSLVKYNYLVDFGFGVWFSVATVGLWLGFNGLGFNGLGFDGGNGVMI
jgi:hypothetical protein